MDWLLDWLRPRDYPSTKDASEGDFVMGLSLAVGYLADLIGNDEEGAQGFRDELARLNHFLATVGIAAHEEPEECKGFSCQMHGYSGLHYLRRIAAHLDLRGVLPPPGAEDSPSDKVLEQYYRLAEQGQRGFWSRLFPGTSPARTFDHLILHSDAEGFYLPREFSSVLSPDDDFQIPGGNVGSSFRLKEECIRLAAALELPLELDPEAEEVWEAADSQGTGDNLWERYGIESFGCLRLYTACQHSLKHGAAIVFC
jgi:hypothetical protein